MLKIWSFLAQHLFNWKKNRSVSLLRFHNLKRWEPYFGCQAKMKSTFDALSSICWGILIMMGSYEPLWPFHSSSPQETVPILKKAHKNRIVSRKVFSLTPTFHSRLQLRPRAWIDSISVWLIASPFFLSCEMDRVILSGFSLN